MLNRPLDIVNKKLFISEDRSTGLRGRATDWEPSGCCCFGPLTFASNRFQSTAGALNYRRSWQRNSFRYIADKQNNYIALRIQRRLSSTLFCYPLPSSRPLTACDDYRRSAKLLVFSGRNEFSPAQQQWCGGDVTKLIYWLEIVNQPHGTRQATISDEPTAAPNTRPFSWIKLLQRWLTISRSPNIRVPPPPPKTRTVSGFFVVRINGRNLSFGTSCIEIRLQVVKHRRDWEREREKKAPFN